MSIFTNIRDQYISWRDNRFDEKMRRSLDRMQNNALMYSPMFAGSIRNYLTPQRRSKMLAEYHIWYMGDPYLLYEYYQNNIGRIKTIGNKEFDIRMFWERVPENLIKVHSGVPGMLASKMAKIKFGQGMTISVEIFKKTTNADGTETIGDEIDENESNRVHDLLVDVLMKKVRYNDMLMQAGEDESWGGHTSQRFAYDPNVSPYPLLETYDARYFTVEKKRGMTTAIIYHNWADIGVDGTTKQLYRFDEVYTTIKSEAELPYFNQWRFDDDTRLCEVGDAAIIYSLFQVDRSTGKEKNIDINKWGSYLELTSGCLKSDNATFYEAVSLPGLKGMLAFEKANRMPNPDFPGSPYGASDFSRCLSQFDKLDELDSEDAQEVRDHKAKELIPISFMPKDKNGKLITERNPFQTNILVSDENANDQDQEQKKLGYGVIQINDRTESLNTKYRKQLNSICANVGISPVSLGIAGFESIDQSAPSQQEREKATIDTRKAALSQWEPYIEDQLMQLLTFESWLFDHYGPTYRQPEVNEINVDFTNCNVKIEFPDYVRSTQAERLTIWGTAKQQGIVSIRRAVEKINPDMSADEIDTEVARIQTEYGIASDNPNALSLGAMLNNTGGQQ